MQGVREGRLHPPSLGEFWVLISIIWSSWQQPGHGKMMSWSQAGRPVRRMFARSGGQHGLRKVSGSGTLNVVKRPTFYWHGKSKQLFEILKDSKFRGSRDLPPGEQLLRAVEECEGASYFLVHCFYFLRAHSVLWASSGFVCMPEQWDSTADQGRKWVEVKFLSGWSLLFSDSQLRQKMTLGPWWCFDADALLPPPLRWQVSSVSQQLSLRKSARPAGPHCLKDMKSSEGQRSRKLQHTCQRRGSPEHLLGSQLCVLGSPLIDLFQQPFTPCLQNYQKEPVVSCHEKEYLWLSKATHGLWVLCYSLTHPQKLLPPDTKEKT